MYQIKVDHHIGYFFSCGVFPLRWPEYESHESEGACKFILSNTIPYNLPMDNADGMICPTAIEV